MRNGSLAAGLGNKSYWYVLLACFAALLCFGATTVLFAQSSSIIETEVGEAQTLSKNGKHAAAIAKISNAVELATNALDPNDPALGILKVFQARILRSAGRLEEAEAAGREAVDSLSRHTATKAVELATAQNDLSDILMRQGKIEQTKVFLGLARQTYREKLGDHHPYTKTATHNLALLLLNLGEHEAAKNLLTDLVASTTVGQAVSQQHISAQIDLARAELALDNIDQAERIIGHARNLVQKSPHAEMTGELSRIITVAAGIKIEKGDLEGADFMLLKAINIEHKTGVLSNSRLGLIYYLRGKIALLQGKFLKAEAHYRKALRQFQTGSSEGSVDIARAYHALALTYQDLGQEEFAFNFYDKAINALEQVFGKTHPQVAFTLNERTLFLIDIGKLDEARINAKRSMAIYKENPSSNPYGAALSSNGYAFSLAALGRYEEAETAFKHGLDSLRKLRGQQSADLPPGLMKLGEIYLEQSRYIEAEKVVKEAIELRKLGSATGPTRLAESYSLLALIFLRQERLKEAYFQSKKAIDLIKAHSSEYLGAATDLGVAEFRLARRVLENHVLISNAMHTIEPREEYIAAAFQSAQLSQYSRVSRDIVRMASRKNTFDLSLATSLRDQQDLLNEWQSVDRQLVFAVSRPAEQSNRQHIASLQNRLKKIDLSLSELSTLLETKFPDFAALTNPTAMKLDDIQKLLKPDEALVKILIGQETSFIWVVSTNSITWKIIDLNEKSVRYLVTELRKGLDAFGNVKGRNQGKGFAPERAGEPEGLPFDLQTAHKLYQKLLRPIEDTIKNKTHLLVVPSGALTSLPLHILVTDKPESALTDYTGYRQAQWLIKRHAITTLPSISSLKALRENTQSRSRAPKLLIGFADPIFQRKNNPVVSASNRLKGVSRYFRGRLANLDELSASLPSLPETADELKAIAKILEVPLKEIRLQDKATEREVKREQLDQYRIIYFSTHGLVAGDLKGLAEPAIALTLPEKATDQDDGLLTASEVAQLRLNAEWVVLSACNTASADRPGAEALSGLARAFFYAGAQTLLVSHWPVYSDAATDLTTTTFRILEDNPGIGRSEALRRSMLALISDTSKNDNAHPSVWAPFVVVGEGGKVQ